MRILWLFLGLAALLLIPYFIWSGSLEGAFSLTGAVAWLEGMNQWAWGAGLLLLVSDLLLPVPSTVVMSALGFVYGTVVGGLISSAGSFFSGSLGYALCRLLGRGAALRLLGRKDLERGERLFANMGGWIVVLSRWLPIFPEAVACMAGLTRMPARTFFLALACGALPLGFVFAAVGHTGVVDVRLALILSAALPALLWVVIYPYIKARSPRHNA